MKAEFQTVVAAFVFGARQSPVTSERGEHAAFAVFAFERFGLSAAGIGTNLY
jgi:hypothetical protein